MSPPTKSSNLTVQTPLASSPSRLNKFGPGTLFTIGQMWPSLALRPLQSTGFTPSSSNHASIGNVPAQPPTWNTAWSKPLGAVTKTSTSPVHVWVRSISTSTSRVGVPGGR